MAQKLSNLKILQFRHVRSPGANGRIQTISLRILSQVLYQCASAAGIIVLKLKIDTQEQGLVYTELLWKVEPLPCYHSTAIHFLTIPRYFDQLFMAP